MKFQSVYNWKNRKVYSEFSLEDLYKIVSNPTKEYIEKINCLRSFERGSKEFNDIKSTLPCFSVAFNFKGYINKANATNATGYMYVDVDNSDDVNIEHPAIAFYCRSVSGKGYTILVGVKGLSKNNLKEATIQVANELDLDLDLKAISVDRLTALSIDPNCRYNPNHSYIDIDIKNPQFIDYYIYNKYNIVTQLNGGKLKTSNLSDIIKDINFNGELVKDFGEDKVGIIELKTPYKNVTEGERNYVMNNICYTLKGLNPNASKEHILSYMNSININKFYPQLLESELSAIVHSVFKMDNIELKPNKFRRFIYNPDYELTTSEKRSQNILIVNKSKADKTFKDLEKAVDNWDKSLGKITQVKLVSVTGKNIKTVEKHYKKLKEKVKIINNNLHN